VTIPVRSNAVSHAGAQSGADLRVFAAAFARASACLTCLAARWHLSSSGTWGFSVVCEPNGLSAGPWTRDSAADGRR
jgi:hypothetical protein